MIQRATDAAFINAVVNHPAVRPYVYAPEGETVDLSAIVKDPNHLVLVGEHGGMVLIQQVPGLYELHTSVLPEGRGEWALHMAHACVEWLFCRTNATELFTRVPKGNIAAMALTRACGARVEHRVEQNLNGTITEVDIFGGRIQDWIKIAPRLEDYGHSFHTSLHAKCAEMGIKISQHADDPWHDRHVGAAAAMILGGQPIKGTLFYNRWASMALAPRMQLLSIDPVVLDIHECRLRVDGDDFAVIYNT